MYLVTNNFTAGDVPSATRFSIPRGTMRSATFLCGSTYYTESIVRCLEIHSDETYLFEIGLHVSEPLFDAPLNVSTTVAYVSYNYQLHTLVFAH